MLRDFKSIVLGREQKIQEDPALSVSDTTSQAPRSINVVDDSPWLDYSLPQPAYPDGQLVIGHGFSKTLDEDGNPEPLHYPIPEDFEPLHWEVPGGTGAGKSTAIDQILACFMRRREAGGNVKFFIPDLGGTAIAKWGRPGDVILNLDDKRFPGMDIVRNDVRKPRDAYTVGDMLIEEEEGQNAFFSTGAKLLVSGAILAAKKKGGSHDSMHAVVHQVNVGTTDELREFLRESKGERYMGLLENDKTAGSFRAVLAENLSPWLDVKPGPFSIRDWVNSDTDPRSVFATLFQDQVAHSFPVLNAIVSLVAMFALMRKEARTGFRFVIVIDEVANYSKIKALVKIATLARKFGIVLVLGFQDRAKMKGTYGETDAQTLLTNLSNKIILRQGSAIPAKDLSDEIGTHEVWERSVNESAGISGGGGSINDGHSIAVREKAILLPGQITGLHKLHGYIKLAGIPNTGRIVIPFTDAPPGYGLEPFIEDPDSLIF